LKIYSSNAYQTPFFRKYQTIFQLFIATVMGNFGEPNVAHNRQFTAVFGLRKIERSEYANQTPL